MGLILSIVDFLLFLFYFFVYSQAIYNRGLWLTIIGLIIIGMARSNEMNAYILHETSTIKLLFFVLIKLTLSAIPLIGGECLSEIDKRDSNRPKY